MGPIGPSSRQEKGHRAWGLGSALCHLPVIAQEGNEGWGQGRAVWLLRDTHQSLSMALSAQRMSLNADAMALGSNSDFAGSFCVTSGDSHELSQPISQFAT